ncbi:antibiotic biosynthesis monooxygenase family protein [Rugamonas rubra]|uniref:Antibiotic biosynthesis monooxygenase n=1 Tax=Rugamonas rubra TaxID=758825 RepID=A0A1I4R4M0_9BURK|nr:antibiotic biosynthesis monooxygenase [Rugamonas rubra]SFM46880.1 Antibiotic biosynthesis monooxygenase [Rugamonas rubra]
MFARVTHVQAKPGKLDEVVALYQESVIPLLAQQDGFHSTFLLTDPASGKGMSITLWNSDAARLAGDSNGFLLQQVMKVVPLLAAPPIPEGYVALGAA